MTSAALQYHSSEEERAALDELRRRYEAEGFEFVGEPGLSLLPAFFGGYRPDAIARKGALNVAIEVKRRSSFSADRSIQQIRRLFQGRDDWQFNVVYLGAPAPPPTIAAASPGEIRAGLDEVRALSGQGHVRAGYILAWALLEAALRTIVTIQADTALTPASLVQTLAMQGFVSVEDERRMREQIALRNRVVHGDVMVRPTQSDLSLLIGVIEEVLASE